MSETPAQPVIYTREQHTVSREHISPAAKKVLTVLNQEGFKAYLVGGGVRDLLLERKPKDFDVVTDAQLPEIKRIFRHCRLIGRRFRLAHVHMMGEIIEVSTFRANRDPEPGEEAETPNGNFAAREDGLILRDNMYGTPEQDARRRDFTVNALFYDMSNFTVVDYVGGMEDIRARVIRSIGPADVRYTEDPVRMIRAIRIASMLGLEIERETYEALITRREHLIHASPARMFEEVRKLLYCGGAERVFDFLDRTGIFGILFPELGSMPSDEKGGAWLRRVMRQFDIWHKAGADVSPELLFALLFAKYHERQAAELVNEGVPEAPALDTATREHLMRLAARITIPRFMINHIGQIMAIQPRFRNPKPRQAERLRHRPCFHDAMIYFKLNSRFSGHHADDVAWWAASGE